MGNIFSNRTTWEMADRNSLKAICTSSNSPARNPPTRSLAIDSAWWRETAPRTPRYSLRIGISRRRKKSRPLRPITNRVISSYSPRCSVRNRYTARVSPALKLPASPRSEVTTSKASLLPSRDASSGWASSPARAATAWTTSRILRA